MAHLRRNAAHAAPEAAIAVTITVGQAAIAIRAAADADNVPVPIATALGLMLPAADAMVMRYAPDAPDAMHNAAAIRLIGWLYDADPNDPRISRPLEVSGAANLLAQWRLHRAAPIGGEPTPITPAPAPGGNVPTPPADGHYILTSNDGELAWLAFPAP